MAYFGFRLDELNVIFQRGKIADVDIVTFTALVNGQPQGKLAGTFVASSGARIPASDVAPDIQGKFGLNLGGWILGPISVQPDDLVQLIYSGFNISDRPQGSDDKIIPIELKMLDSYYGALSGEVVGVLGDLGTLLSGVVGGFSGLTETLLGYKPPETCNGTVFYDALPFTGNGLAQLQYSQQSPGLEFQEFSFTHTYDDSATHDTSMCGHIAQTEVTFSALSFPSLSFRYIQSLFWPNKDFSKGLRQLGEPGKALSFRTLICS